MGPTPHVRPRSRRPKRKKRPKCKINKVWGYPATGAVIRYAWSCKCGRHNETIATRDQAEAEVASHLADSG